MADLGAITEAVAGTLEESRIEAARALIVDQEREQHDSVLSTFRPQARKPPNQDPRSHIQDGKYAVFFDNSPHCNIAMLHHIFNWCLGGELGLAPIGKNIKHVLDIKSCSGIWAFEYAQEHPNVEVVGFDIFDNALEPKHIPWNCTFKVHNPNLYPWPFQQKFDYIHGRGLVGYSRPVIQQAFNVLKPGGYLELQGTLCHYMTIDDPFPGNAFREYLDAQSRPGENVVFCKRFMEEAGYVDIVEKHFQLPVGGWPKDQHCKEVGKLFKEAVAGRIFENTFSRQDRRMSTEKEMDLADRALEDLDDPRIHGYVPILVVYGRKPE